MVVQHEEQVKSCSKHGRRQQSYEKSFMSSTYSNYKKNEHSPVGLTEETDDIAPFLLYC